MIIIIICLAAGLLLGYFANLNISTEMSVYIAIGILAAFDSVLGGIVANTNKNFNLAIFVSGFFSNAILSVAIIYLGTKLGLDLYIGVMVAFIIRIFQNFAIIRRFLLNKYVKSDKIEKQLE